jgi:arsenate reductase
MEIGVESKRDRIKILFLCMGNSCRSQMAEGWTKHLKGDRIDVWSAGITPKGVDPLAVQVMAEAGANISGQRSKNVSEVRDIPFDAVITLCDQARESCPLFPKPVRRIHVGFDDPPFLAQNAQNEEEALGIYRRVRDEIRKFVETLPESLDSSKD